MLSKYTINFLWSVASLNNACPYPEPALTHLSSCVFHPGLHYISIGSKLEV